MNLLLFVVNQFSWISWIVSNYEIKIPRIFVTLYECTECSRVSTNLHVHENKIVTQTRKIEIYEFKWLHITVDCLLSLVRHTIDIIQKVGSIGHTSLSYCDVHYFTIYFSYLYMYCITLPIMLSSVAMTIVISYHNK